MKMRIKLKVFLCIVVCIFFLGFVQNGDSNLIPYSEIHKLKTDDFLSFSTPGSSKKAYTVLKYETKTVVSNDSIVEFRLVCYFVRNQSWMKEKSTSLLSHEQTHFDIGELYMRKLRMLVLKVKYSPSVSIKRLIDNKLDSLMKAEQIQEKYDLETNHSLNKEKQKEWEIRIQKELNDLSEYKKTNIRIKKK